jgi:serine/threonine-protein kinase HipA
VGTLLSQEGRLFFEYEEAWLQTGLNLSPFQIPFQRGVFEHKDRAFGPLPGLFEDGLPDGWGHLLMDRHFHSLGREPASVGPLERLAWLGNRTMGALTYYPPTDSAGQESGPFVLEELARQSREVLAGTSSQVLPRLLRAGGSPGGARPKVLVGCNLDGKELRSGEEDLPPGFEHWLIKFPASEDGPDAGAAEFAYSLMARSAGIEMAETRLFETAEGGRYFGIKRFDRADNRRFHIHSFGNLIHADFRIPSCDYLDLLKATFLLTRRYGEVLKAFRRAAFNVFAHNRDDHAKNFAFMLDAPTGAWTCTPAYDLSFSPGPRGEHSMTVNGEGRAPGIRHLLALAEAREVTKDEALAILDAVRAAVSRWPDFAKMAGLPAARTKAIGRILASSPP